MNSEFQDEDETLKSGSFQFKFVLPDYIEDEDNDDSDMLCNHLKSNTGLFTIFEFFLCILLSIIYIIAYNQETNSLKDPKTGQMELSETELKIKFMIFMAVILKTTLYFTFNISTWFIKNGGSETELAKTWCWKGCTKETSNTIIKYGLYQLIPLLYFPWWIYVLYKFHFDLEDIYDCTKMLTVGLTLMVVEAYLYLIFYAIFFWFLAIVSILLIRLSTKYRRSILQFKKSVKDVVLVKLSGIRYDNELTPEDNLEFITANYSWWICTEDFTEVGDVMQLPWNFRHVFHKDCLADWLDTWRVWPCWKACII